MQSESEMNKPWSEIAGSFRDHMEITMPKGEFIMWLLVVLLIIIGSWWLMIFLRQWQQFRSATEYLDKYELNPEQRRLLNIFIRDFLYNRPQNIPQVLSRFNLWVDSVLRQRSENGELIGPEDQFLADIKQIRETVFLNRRAQRPFSSSRDLEANLTLSLRVTGYPTVYQAVVISMDDLAITLRLTKEQDMPQPTPGTPILASMAQAEALYNFEALFLDMDNRGGSFRISHSTEWRAIQMRAHYRHPVHLPVEFRYFLRLPNGEAIIDQGDGTVVELSGGGFTLISQFQGVDNGQFTFDFHLLGKQQPKLTGNITRHYQDKASSDFIIYNCEFRELDPEFREDIIHYIFARQREL